MDELSQKFLLKMMTQIATIVVGLCQKLDATGQNLIASNEAGLAVALAAQELDKRVGGIEQEIGNIRRRLRELEELTDIATLDARVGALEMMVDAGQSGEVGSTGDSPDDAR